MDKNISYQRIGVLGKGKTSWDWKSQKSITESFLAETI